MTKKSILGLTFAALLSAGVVAGCGAKDNRTKVVFWHTMGQTNQDTLNRMIKEFETANPDIKIEHSSQGDYASIYSKLKSAIPAGTTPTMAFCYADHVADYLAAGAVQDLDTYINNAELTFTEADGYHTEGEVKKIGKDDFIQGYWGEGTNYASSGTYSVPFSKSTEVLFYNVEWFEQHPTVQNPKTIKTWDEMWTACEAIRDIFVEEGKIKTDGSNPNNYFPLGYDSDSNLFISMCQQRNIPYTKNAEKASERFLFNNSQAKALIQDFVNKRKANIFATKNTLPDNTYTSTLFTEGNCVMSIGSTGGTSYNTSKNFTVGVVPVPVTNAAETDKTIISQGPSICFFKRTTEAQKVAAWKFYKHISNTYNTAAYSMLTGYEPVRTSAYESEQYKNYLTESATNLCARVANVTKDLQSRYFYSPVFKGSAQARESVSSLLNNVYYGTKTLDKAFSDAIDECLRAA